MTFEVTTKHPKKHGGFNRLNALNPCYGKILTLQQYFLTNSSVTLVLFNSVKVLKVLYLLFMLVAKSMFKKNRQIGFVWYLGFAVIRHKLGRYKYEHVFTVVEQKIFIIVESHYRHYWFLI